MDLHIEDLVVSRGAGDVLSGLSLSVPQESLMGLVGKNGAGKTTLLETVAGLLSPRAGRIMHGGANLAGLPAHAVARGGVALVPEGRKLFLGMTVMENLALGVHNRLWVHRLPAGALNVVWDLFPDLYEKRKNKCGALSGGQQQMVALGRALASSPSLIMLDEPTFGLSPQLTEEICEHLLRLTSAGLTILLAEQNLDVVLDVVPRLAVLDHGVIVASGAIEDLKSSEQLYEAMFGSRIGDG